MGLLKDATDKAALADLAGVDLHHDFQLVVPDWAAWIAIGEVLARDGAGVHAVRATPRDDGFDIRCRLDGISEAAARRLSAAFLDGGLATHAKVEHLVLAKRSA